MEIGRNPKGARDKSVQVVSVNPRIPDGEGEACDPRQLRLSRHGAWTGQPAHLRGLDRCDAPEGGGGTWRAALFLQGATANINPDMYWEDGRAFEKVTEQGISVAEAVFAAIRQESSKDASHFRWRSNASRHGCRPRHLSAHIPPAKEITAKPLLAMANMPGFMAVFADILLNQRYPWKPVIEAQDGFWSVPMRINVVRIGDLALVTFGAETFTEIGMKVKVSLARRAHALCQRQRRVHQLPAHGGVTRRGWL